MNIPGLAQLRAQLKYTIQKIRPVRPLPLDFDLQKGRKKLAFVNAEIDKLVDKYDKSYIQTRKHPDVIAELKLHIIDALIVKFYDTLNNKPPFPTKAIEEIFDEVYKETFVNCILPENALIAPQSNELYDPDNAFERLLASSVEPLPLHTVMVQAETNKSFQDAIQLKNSISLNPEVPVKKDSYDLTKIIIHNDRRFRSHEESLLCKIAYNKEKIKFLDAQYDLLETYLSKLYCEHLTPEQRLKFVFENKYRLPNIKCSPLDKTPGNVEKLFTNFSELLLNVENSKEALEANGMSI